MKRQLLIKKDDNGDEIFRINRTTKKGIYFLKKDSFQIDLVREIELEGFDNLPTGLWRDGKGFTKGGLRILQAISKEIHNPRIRVSATRKSAIRGKTVTINHSDLRQIGETVRRIDSERAAETRGEVTSFLGNIFPKHFDSYEAESLYQPGQVATLLKDRKVVEKLSDVDKETLLKMYPALVREGNFTLRASQKLKFVTEGIGAARTIYLDKVIKEFRKKLSKSGSESAWQTFLREHILMMLNTYAAVIEKQSIAIGGKYPDFMLVDAYGYVDIYEIKKPDTDLLKYDEGRDNYYWSAEVSRAVSQTEKYIDEVNKNRLDIADKVRRKYKTEVNLIRPRGFIVVGKRKQLANRSMKDDFRILNDSLKNIDIIFFDDLLDNVILLYERFKTKRKTGKATR